MSVKPARHILSKFTFLRGCQCPKALYLYKKQPELRGKISDQQQAVFDRGTNVGELAQQLFPGGTDAGPETPFKYAESVVYTQELIKKGIDVIYEAAFQYDGVLAAIDILVKKNGKWKAYEVKSSTEVKDVNILDASLQYYVITHSCIKLSDISIIHINNEYVRQGKLNIKELFNAESILADVRENQEFIEEKIAELKKVILQNAVPKVDIGPHCSDPYECDFRDHCWSHIPENSVFDIAGLRTVKKFDLYSQGLIRYKQIESNEMLNEKQQQQVALFLKKENYIDKKGIKDFLKSITYPIHFLDFETFNPAVPIYDQSRPYQQIPFQYSLHYLEKKKASLKHFEFLAQPNGDPRLPFIENLIDHTAAPGDILTYNQSFEIGCLNNLVGDFPKYAKHLNKIIARIKDLMQPFRERLYYVHNMHGSYSIKQVLPALIPDLNYDDLPINNGGDASLAFEQMVFNPSADHSELRKALMLYCSMDTLAMVKLVEKLGEV
jgi:cytochrome c-type biogenesis protein CcmE